MTDPDAGRLNTHKCVILMLAAATACLGGCAPETNTTNDARKLAGQPPAVPSADRIALLVPENAIVNLDDSPGPDGVIAQVMLFKDYGKGPKSVLVSGEVDLMVFEGSKPAKLLNAPKPFFARTFTARELAQRVVKQYNMLWGYSLQAKWLTAPRTKDVWLLARFRPQSGSAIYSSPAGQRMPSN